MMVALNGSSADNGDHQTQELVDRLSQLPDNILVLVLEKLNPDARWLARISLLSKRWQAIPLMLSCIDLSIHSFLRHHRSSARRYQLHLATCKFIAALRFFLAADTVQRHIHTLTLRFALTKDRRHLSEIGRLVGAAVRRGEVRRLELTLDTVEQTSALQSRGLIVAEGSAGVYARRFASLLRPAASGTGSAATLSPSITKLVLRNLCFREPTDLEPVLRDCKALETLHLSYCWFELEWPVLTVDAPRSRLRELKLRECAVRRVHLVRAPQLAHLTCEEWISFRCPVRFDPNSVPALVSITLVNQEFIDDEGDWHRRTFKLSKLMENANPVEYMRLDFASGMVNSTSYASCM